MTTLEDLPADVEYLLAAGGTGRAVMVGTKTEADAAGSKFRWAYTCNPGQVRMLLRVTPQAVEDGLWWPKVVRRLAAVA